MSEGGSAAPTGARIAGFWRRLIAAIVDWLILGVPAFVIGYLLFDVLAPLGQNGRAIGAAISLAYFGILNSSIGGGQTLGKKLLGIRVVGASGSPIALPRAFVRWLVLALPFYLNGLDFTPLVEGVNAETATAVGALALLFVFGFGTAHFYLYVFNRKTRQSLHDLFVESFVVRVKPDEAVAVRVWPTHVWIALALLAASLIVPTYMNRLTSLVATKETFAALQAIADELEKNPQVMQAGASTETVTSWSNKEATTTTSFLIVTVYVRKRFDDADPLMREVAKVVLRREPQLLGNDQLKVIVVAAFDLGIASGTFAESKTGTAEEWRRELGGGPILVRSEEKNAVTAFIGRGRDLLRFILPQR